MSKAPDDPWQEFARGVKPLAKKAVKPKAVAKPAAQTKAARANAIAAAEAAIVPDPNSVQRKQPERVQIALKLADKEEGWQLDRNTVKQLRVGRIAIDAKLDLHGMTQDEAKEALHTLIMAARKGSKRCLLIITGKGSRGDGVLKKQVPRWLGGKELGPLIIGMQEAAPRHGGSGALYVLLRRKLPKL